nr:antirestriction protein ArdA [Dorea formicigenerans]
MNTMSERKGELVGDWFSFPLDEEVIAERIGLNAEYEEYAIHDTDNFPMEISEYISIEELNRIYEQLEELPDYLLDDLDSFISCYGSLDLAYYLIDEEQILGEIPSSLQNYIDYEAYGRDLDIEGTFIATNAGICEVLR